MLPLDAFKRMSIQNERLVGPRTLQKLFIFFILFCLEVTRLVFKIVVPLAVANSAIIAEKKEQENCILFASVKIVLKFVQVCPFLK